ncbi:ComEA family DNA-binding protein [Candidatus Desantisbacteria bacterium]|nr:ComEA family DNA-binding protein [Candidatus Desantisbacteria bacterium]
MASGGGNLSVRFLTFTRLQQVGIIVLSCTALLASGIMICQGMAEKRDVSVRFIPEEIRENAGTRTAKDRVLQRIDINTASARELMVLPRVGSCTAARIIEYRKRHGKFSSTKELLNVKGIGPKTLAKMQEEICVGTGSISTVGVGSKPTPTTPVKRVGLEPTPIININTASASELEALPGIGPGKAKAILDYRNSCGLFQKIEDITLVKGIGEKIFEQIKPLITVGEKLSGDNVSSDVPEITK